MYEGLGFNKRLFVMAVVVWITVEFPKLINF